MGHEAVTERALTRLMTIDKRSEEESQALRLGRLVHSHIRLATVNPLMQFAGSENYYQRVYVAAGEEYKVYGRVAASMRFCVDRKFDALQNTPEWLPKAHQVQLLLSTYDVALPDNLGLAPDSGAGLPDATSEVAVYLEPTTEYSTAAIMPHEQCYVAMYDNRDPLDAQDTETVIGVLALLADKIQQ